MRERPLPCVTAWVPMFGHISPKPQPLTSILKVKTYSYYRVMEY